MINIKFECTTYHLHNIALFDVYKLHVSTKSEKCHPHLVTMSDCDLYILKVPKKVTQCNLKIKNVKKDQVERNTNVWQIISESLLSCFSLIMQKLQRRNAMLIC